MEGRKMAKLRNGRKEEDKEEQMEERRKSGSKWKEVGSVGVYGNKEEDKEKEEEVRRKIEDYNEGKKEVRKKNGRKERNEGELEGAV